MTSAGLSSSERKRLKGLAHHLDPVVQIGRSELTEAVAAETERALEAHELIKVRIDSDDRSEREEIARNLAERLDADLVGTIGKIAILWRPAEEE